MKTKEPGEGYADKLSSDSASKGQTQIEDSVVIDANRLKKWIASLQKKQRPPS